jgi:hypothetical protein
MIHFSEDPTGHLGTLSIFFFFDTQSVSIFRFIAV